MPRKNKEGKWKTFYVAKTGPDGQVGMREIEDPYDPRLQGDPDLTAPGAGQLRLENDDQVWIVATGDEAAHEHVQRMFRDGAALAQEHMIPHQPYRPEGECVGSGGLPLDRSVDVGQGNVKTALCAGCHHRLPLDRHGLIPRHDYESPPAVG